MIKVEIRGVAVSAEYLVSEQSKQHDLDLYDLPTSTHPLTPTPALGPGCPASAGEAMGP